MKMNTSWWEESDGGGDHIVRGIQVAYRGSQDSWCAGADGIYGVFRPGEHPYTG